MGARLQDRFAAVVPARRGGQPPTMTAIASPCSRGA